MFINPSTSTRFQVNFSGSFISSRLFFCRDECLRMWLIEHNKLLKKSVERNSKMSVSMGRKYASSMCLAGLNNKLFLAGKREKETGRREKGKRKKEKETTQAAYNSRRLAHLCVFSFPISLLLSPFSLLLFLFAQFLCVTPDHFIRFYA